MTEPRPISGPSATTQRVLLFALAIITLLVYARTLTCGFVDYDDGLYVFDNTFVRGGVTIEGLKHVFTHGETGTWQPIAMVSHMLDCQIFGLRAWGHHLTAILLHTLNAVLLAFAMTRLTRQFYPSLAVAAIFALHPAHVESVAWISERKDVLSTLFWMLCLLAYERYARAGGIHRYLFLILLFVLGLMTKPMLVTLPCVLLLLDYWPLGRIENRTAKAVFEKLPLFAIVVASCIVTMIVQRQNQSVVSLGNLPLAARLGNVAVSYIKYIGIMIRPFGLGIDYPHPKDTLPAWQIAGSCVLLAGITALVFLVRKRAPYLVTGWLWYLGTFVPVVGFVQIGEQGMADRYTYIPTIGLAICAVWTVEPLFAVVTPRKTLVYVAILLASWSLITFRQIGFWHDTESLWTRAVTVNPANERAQRSLGSYLLDKERYEEAIPRFDAATKLSPADPRNWQGLGFAQMRRGQIDLALEHYKKSFQLDSANIDTRNGLALCLITLNRDAEAISLLEETLRMRLYDVDTRTNLGAVLCKVGRAMEALPIMEEAVRDHPESAMAHNVLGIALNLTGKREDAIREFKEALRLKPDYASALRNLTALSMNDR